ncbi:MAG TPA: toll/interleukin-1 receptor domain-containing protein [Thermoanaerobaculia bacterium]|nr:toll/interleukin-1 receptor domain-containing protein [Thermoanaerobaculia bacterium]
MADGFTYDVFLSHNAQDKPRVRKLAERLRDAGLRVWFDDWVVKPGDDIYLAIERGLEAARVQVLCLSPEALASEWVTLERNTVLFRDPTALCVGSHLRSSPPSGPMAQTRGSLVTPLRRDAVRRRDAAGPADATSALRRMTAVLENRPSVYRSDGRMASSQIVRPRVERPRRAGWSGGVSPADGVSP